MHYEKPCVAKYIIIIDIVYHSSVKKDAWGDLLLAYGRIQCCHFETHYALTVSTKSASVRIWSKICKNFEGQKAQPIEAVKFSQLFEVSTYSNGSFKVLMRH